MTSSSAPSTPADEPAGAGRPSRTPVEKVSGTSPRPATLRRSPVVMRIGMVVFCIGASALLVMLVLFASGARDFPVWFWLVVALAPIGLGISAFRIRQAGLSVD
ncbi:hypothetical protein ABLG96_18085 [Nakamurella sp. A5-74]|uniref:DUF2530 domain-containing protein n=1 Tax=Nakamurella sp. A5-74 TaxID=3158264 RepID=A0AAU8DNK3_9ACTN